MGIDLSFHWLPWGPRPATAGAPRDGESWINSQPGWWNMGSMELGTYLGDAQQPYHACIEACVECWAACEMCSDACLHEANVEQMVRCIRLDRDCAAICRLAAEAMIRGSELAARICALCAEICDACAEECEKHAQHHDHCRVCATACRRCAEECRRMAA